MKSVQESNTVKSIKKLARDERGATAVEYIMLVGLIAIAGAIAFNTFGTDVQGAITAEGSKVTGFGNGTP